MSEKRKYRQLTVAQKTDVVLAGLRGDRRVRGVCREHEIAYGRPAPLIGDRAPFMDHRGARPRIGGVDAALFREDLLAHRNR
jgi:hypothetical protein